MFNDGRKVQLDQYALMICDELVIKLGLDKLRSLYFYNSRK